MKKLICPLFFLLFIAACSKKDKGPNKTDLLTNGSWKLTASELDDDANGTYEIDVLSGASACFLDNFVTFYNGGQMVSDEGPTKCDINDPQTENFSWQLSNDGNQLTVDGDSYDVLELTSSTLKLKQSLSGGRSSRATFSKR
jgi:hypothetical protein